MTYSCLPLHPLIRKHASFQPTPIRTNIPKQKKHDLINMYRYSQQLQTFPEYNNTRKVHVPDSSRWQKAWTFKFITWSLVEKAKGTYIFMCRVHAYSHFRVHAYCHFKGSRTVTFRNIITMEICKAPTLQRKVLNKDIITHIMYIEMEMLSAIKN